MSALVVAAGVLVDPGPLMRAAWCDCGAVSSSAGFLTMTPVATTTGTAQR